MRQHRFSVKEGRTYKTNRRKGNSPQRHDSQDRPPVRYAQYQLSEVFVMCVVEQYQSGFSKRVYFFFLPNGPNSIRLILKCKYMVLLYMTSFCNKLSHRRQDVMMFKNDNGLQDTSLRHYVQML